MVYKVVFYNKVRKISFFTFEMLKTSVVVKCKEVFS